MRFEIVVLGTPAPQGSKKAFVVAPKGGGKPRAVVTDDNPKPLQAWRSAVQETANRWVDWWEDEVSEDGRGSWRPWSGPIMLKITFHLRAPGVVPKDRLGWPTVRPDLGKYQRSTEDALTAGRIWGDDGQVIAALPRKVYADPGQPAGAHIVAWPAGPFQATAGLREIATGLRIVGRTPA